MLLSIVIPTYQSGQYIGAALQSVRAQTFKDYEIIIIDGGSIDDTLSVVNKFDNLPIRFYQEPDKGVYDAMNKGISLAIGDWVYFMGSDDSLYDDRVLESIALVGATEKADVLYGDVVLASSGKRYAGEFSLHRLLFSENICHQAVFYKRSIFNRIGHYNLDYKIWADWDFNIRCFKHTEFVINYLDIVVALYNDQSGVSSKEDVVLVTELPLFYLYQIEFLKQQNAQLLSSKSFVIGSKLIGVFNKIGVGKFFK